MSALRQSVGDCGQIPLDIEHLRRQCPDVGSDPLAYFLRHGLEQKLDPTPWFVTDWYAWQNPDCVAFDSPYLHYLSKGNAEGRDPSPFVDIRRYQAISGVPAATIYALILAGHRSVALGVYENRSDLARCQDRFRAGINVVAHKIMPKPVRKKALVVLQAGPAAVARDWVERDDREWDLLVNYYDATGFRPGFGDYVFFQKGTKFTAMWLLWERYREILAHYEHVLFLDDDVAVAGADLDHLFRKCRRHGLDLAQMSLSKGSSCNWRELFTQSGKTSPRKVSAVEIMMPVFSASALRQVARTFAQSVSGFGLDLAWGKLIHDAGGKIAVLDDVVATHARPVDQTDGAYYAYLRRHMINAKSELWVLLKDYDADRNLTSV